MAETGEKKARSGTSRSARRTNGSERVRDRSTSREGRRLERLCDDLRHQVEDADRAKRELLSVVSHDLRNPLSVILVSAKLLGRSIPSDAPGRKQLDSIGRAAEEINHLIQDLLDANIIEGGALEVSCEPQEMAEVVGRAMDVARPLCAQKQIQLRGELPPQLPPVLGDADRLVQVVAAFVANAVKFTPKGGEITVRAAAQNGELVVSVTDTGPGIPADHRPLLFGRRSHAMRPLGQGIGLAMFVAKGIIDAHGGRTWVESELGRGATFHLGVPIAPAGHGGDTPHPGSNGRAH
jgi:signal transduction histidine kinase